ncbi:hypothetical protein HXX76_014260 [Chlamydomonas incerta]|uniref:EGF-like domain-containing protein n=1 Tax=Chlamydomonas incerta TaxID=51695 RepID=A0A835SLX5_CHLIN|nr:hypothetical protein HXX76_014260 [Chlamydomonas incerta]|eukprot:KAG2424684.1 hypothetical protein HXX76_014260 [Chlamydomonas incerta]
MAPRCFSSRPGAIPWSYACSCPDINDHYPGGNYPGSFTFDDATKTCVDATSSPKCEYGTFRYNGACVDDPCFDANYNSPCSANQVCSAAADGASYTCTCRGQMVSGVCKINPCMATPCPVAGSTCSPSFDFTTQTCFCPEGSSDGSCAIKGSCTGTTADAPSFIRPSSGSPPTSTSAYNVKYKTHIFKALVSGSVALRVDALNNGWDTFLFLYNAPFNPAAQLTNIIIGNDDLAGAGRNSGFTVNLVAGNVYVLVVTGYMSTNSGTYTISSNPNASTVGICV